MTTVDIFRSINLSIQGLYDNSLNENEQNLNSGMLIISNLNNWVKVIPDERYKYLINNSIQSLELSLVSQTYCFYRNAFASLRLSLEMLFGCVYFSTSLLEYIEWEKSSRDLNWSTINNLDNGILSHRFANAFFPDLGNERCKYFTRVNELYRDLSEFVHGNHHTWKLNADAIRVDKSEIVRYGKNLNEFNEIVNYVLCIRFIKKLKKQELELIEPIIIGSLSHIISIHNHFAENK